MARIAKTVLRLPDLDQAKSAVLNSLGSMRLERSFRSPYCCSDGVSGRGASVKYLSHGVSLVLASIVPPPHRGTKHRVNRPDA